MPGIPGSHGGLHPHEADTLRVARLHHDTVPSRGRTCPTGCGLEGDALHLLGEGADGFQLGAADGGRLLRLWGRSSSGRTAARPTPSPGCNACPPSTTRRRAQPVRPAPAADPAVETEKFICTAEPRCLGFGAKFAFLRFCWIFRDRTHVSARPCAQAHPKKNDAPAQRCLVRHRSGTSAGRGRGLRHLDLDPPVERLGDLVIGGLSGLARRGRWLDGLPAGCRGVGVGLHLAGPHQRCGRCRPPSRPGRCGRPPLMSGAGRWRIGQHAPSSTGGFGVNWSVPSRKWQREAPGGNRRRRQRPTKALRPPLDA